MRIRKYVILSVICLFVAALFGTNTVSADTVDDAKSVIGGIAMYKMSESGAGSVQEWADGGIRDGAGADTDAYAYALYRLGLADVSSYCDALGEYLAEKDVRSATTRLKYALCLCMSDPTHEYIKKTLDDSIGRLGIMSFVYGQHLANNGVVGKTYTSEQIALEILAMQHPDGGWSVMGQSGDVDVTAMVLQALAGIGSESGASRPAAIEIAADRAVRFLSQKQNEDGGYSGFGNENAESTAQVLIALSSLGIDAASDPGFVKNGNSVIDGIMKYSLPDGSFSHIKGGNTDSTATSQVFTAMAAYVCFREGEIYYMVGKPRNMSLVSIPEAPSYRNVSDLFGESGPAAVQSETEVTGLDAVQTETEAAGSDAVQTETEAAGADAGQSETEAAGSDAGQSETEAAGSDADKIFTGSGADTETVLYKAEREPESGIKTILLFGVLGLSIIAAGLLLIFKKRNPKNFLFILIVAGIAAVVIFFSDFKTEDEYYTADNNIENSVGQVTITIRCDTIAGYSDPEFIPENGVILDTTTYEFGEGDTVYDILIKAVRENRIHMERKKTGSGPKDYYICGIANIYEYDWGELSGWMYYVNGESPSVGCGEYRVKPGDRIEWHFTKEIGRDLEIEPVLK